MKKINLAFIFIFIISLPVAAQNNSNRLAKAFDLFNKKNYPLAYEQFNSILNGKNEVKDAATASFYLAECLLKLNEIDGAISQYEKFAEDFHFSNFRDLAFYRLGTIYFAKKDYAKAREKFIILLNEYPASDYIAASNFFVGESYMAEKRFLEAEEYYKKAISLEKTNPYMDQSIFSLANLYENMHKYEDAVTYYDRLLTYYRDSKLIPAAQLRIGICYFELKNYDNTILELTEQPVKQLPEDKQLEAQYYIANANYRLKEYDNAKTIYRNIISANPSPDMMRQAKYGLAWTFFQSEDFKNAYSLFDNLYKTGQDTIGVSSYFWSGEAKRYSGDKDAARAIAEDFVKKYPDNYLAPRAKFNIGSMDYDKGENVNAERNLQAILNTKDEVTKAKAYTFLGEISLNKKDFNNALINFNNALSNSAIGDELRERSLLGVGITDFYLNKYDDAIRNLTSLNAKSEKYDKNKVNFYIAESYFAKGEFAKALKYYNSIQITNDDLGRQALYGKAYAYLNLRNYANSSFYFKEYTSKFKNSDEYLDARLRLADSYFGMKEFDKAGSIYSDIFSKQRVDLNDDASYYQYVRALYMSNKRSQALNELEAFKRKFPNSKYYDNVQYLIGWINFQKNEFQKAIDGYKNIYQNNPSSPLRPVAYTGIGDCYYNLAEYDSALVFYRRIFSNYPNSQYVFDAIRGIQDCYMMKDQPENAIAEIDKFLSANPKSKYADQMSYKKGDIYYSINNYVMAISSYSAFISTYPKSDLVPNAYYWTGKSYVMNNNPAEAKNNFKVVADKFITSEVGVDAVIELGNIYLNEENFNDALTLYDRAIKELPDSKRMAELLFMKAGIYLKTNDLSKAYQAYNDIINYYDGSIFASKAKIELGLLELAGGRPENAEPLFRSEAESKVDDLAAKAQYYLGVSLFQQNKIQDAIIALVRIRSVFGMFDEWFTKSLITLGDCYVKLNDKAKAREMYQAVLIRHKDDTYATEATKKLKDL